MHGFVSPCHSLSAFKKLKSERINSRHRVEMIKSVVGQMENWDVDLEEMYAEEELSLEQIFSIFIKKLRDQIFKEN